MKAGAISGSLATMDDLYSGCESDTGDSQSSSGTLNDEDERYASRRDDAQDTRRAEGWDHLHAMEDVLRLAAKASKGTITPQVDGISYTSPRCVWRGRHRDLATELSTGGHH